MQALGSGALFVYITAHVAAEAAALQAAAFMASAAAVWTLIRDWTDNRLSGCRHLNTFYCPCVRAVKLMSALKTNLCHRFLLSLLFLTGTLKMRAIKMCPAHWFSHKHHISLQQWRECFLTPHIPPASSRDGGFSSVIPLWRRQKVFGFQSLFLSLTDMSPNQKTPNQSFFGPAIFSKCFGLMQAWAN